MPRLSVMVGAMLGISSSVCGCVDLRISFSMFLRSSSMAGSRFACYENMWRIAFWCAKQAQTVDK